MFWRCKWRKKQNRTKTKRPKYNKIPFSIDTNGLRLRNKLTISDAIETHHGNEFSLRPKINEIRAHEFAVTHSPPYCRPMRYAIVTCFLSLSLPLIHMRIFSTSIPLVSYRLVSHCIDVLTPFVYCHSWLSNNCDDDDDGNWMLCHSLTTLQ